MLHVGPGLMLRPHMEPHWAFPMFGAFLYAAVFTSVQLKYCCVGPS